MKLVDLLTEATMTAGWWLTPTEVLPIETGLVGATWLGDEDKTHTAYLRVKKLFSGPDRYQQALKKGWIAVRRYTHPGFTGPWYHLTCLRLDSTAKDRIWDWSATVDKTSDVQITPALAGGAMYDTTAEDILTKFSFGDGVHESFSFLLKTILEGEKACLEIE